MLHSPVGEMKHKNFIFGQKKLKKLSNLFHQKALPS